MNNFENDAKLNNYKLGQTNVSINEEGETVDIEIDNDNEYSKNYGEKKYSDSKAEYISKDKRISKILLITLIIVLIGLSILIPTGVLQNVRTSKSYDTAKDFFYKEQYTNASKEIGITNELSKSVFINSDLKKNISALSTEISQYCALEKSKKAFYETKNIQETRLQLNLAIVNSEISKKEQDFIREVVEEEYRQENRARIEVLLADLMKKYEIKGTYDNTPHYLYGDKVGICGVAELEKGDTNSNELIIKLTTYSDQIVNIYVSQQGESYEFGSQIRELLTNNKKIEIACIAYPYAGLMNLYTYTYYKNRLVPENSKPRLSF